MTREAYLVFGTSRTNRTKVVQYLEEQFAKERRQETVLIDIDHLVEKILEEGQNVKQVLDSYITEYLDYAYLHLRKVIYSCSAAQKGERKKILKTLQSYNYSVVGYWTKTSGADSDPKDIHKLEKVEPSYEEGFTDLKEVELTRNGIKTAKLKDLVLN